MLADRPRSTTLPHKQNKGGVKAIETKPKRDKILVGGSQYLEKKKFTSSKGRKDANPGETR